MDDLKLNNLGASPSTPTSSSWSTTATVKYQRDAVV